MMITILAKIFVKENNEKYRQNYGTLCSCVGIFLNILLFCGKYFVGMISGSIAIMADAFNNLSDAGSSFITLVGFWFAGKKPDPGHPFGHGRFEYISGFVVSIAIIMMGFELAKTSIGKIFNPEPVETSMVAIAVLLASILIKMYMAYYNNSIGKKIDSSAMKATSMDSLSDSVATTVVLLSVLVMKFFSLNVDGIGGLLVSVFILYAGYNAVKETIGPLLGKKPEPEFVDQIEQIVMSHQEILGMHDLVVHDYGPGRCLISLHAEVPGDCDIFAVHDVIDNIEKELNTKLACESVIHMDPIETNNEMVTQTKKEILALVQKIDQRFTIHDFRMVIGNTHTNVIFDLVVPYDIKKTKEEIIAEVQQQIKALNRNMYAIITVDSLYV